MIHYLFILFDLIINRKNYFESSTFFFVGENYNDNRDNNTQNCERIL